MESIFLKILNMSITATWLVLAVAVLRLLLRRAPKALHVVMWALVGVRLLCPFSVESMWSLIPSAETLPGDILYTDTPMIQSGIPVINGVVNPVILDSFAPTAGNSVNPMQIAVFVGAVIWMVGVAAMLIYMAASYFRVHRTVCEATPLRENIWICDHIDTPFILGVFRPRIYLPSRMVAGDVEYVVAHEQAHLRRRDHWWKPLGFLLLSIHWFNPILWVAYILLCRDIELACDEKVIGIMGAEQKKAYSDALINCSAPRTLISACPLAFGEVGIRQRIRTVLHYKKPAFWVVLTTIIVCVMLVVGFLTDPQMKLDQDLKDTVQAIILEQNRTGYLKGEYGCADWVLLGTEREGKDITLYTWVLYEEYSRVDGAVKNISGGHCPVAITLRQHEDGYELLEYWEPRDGEYFPSDIQEKFPKNLHRKALNSQRYIKAQIRRCEKQAKAYFETLQNEQNPYMQQLRAQYPQYFGLPTDKGLVVYIWQFGPVTYYCGLVDGRNIGHTDEEILSLQGIGIPEMRAIVESYGIEKERVSICHIRHPLSSYWGTIDHEKMKDVFWKTGEIGETPEFSTIMAAKTFDVDGDGREENCVLSFGPTSGLFTVVFAAAELGQTEREYYNTFQLPYGGAPVAFEACENGAVQLVFFQNSRREVRYDISVKDGNVVLSFNGEPAPYYGKQGITE